MCWLGERDCSRLWIALLFMYFFVYVSFFLSVYFLHSAFLSVRSVASFPAFFICLVSFLYLSLAIYLFRQCSFLSPFYFHPSFFDLFEFNFRYCRSQWPRGLRRRSTAARLLGLWFRIPPGAWMFVCCECFVLSGRVLCDELITRPEESYRLWCVVMCDLENLMNEEPYTVSVIELNIGDTSPDVFPTCH